MFLLCVLFLVIGLLEGGNIHGKAYGIEIRRRRRQR